jgi:hypothetical protein
MMIAAAHVQSDPAEPRAAHALAVALAFLTAFFVM